MADEYKPTPSRGPGRPRKEETQERRRRRNSLDGSAGMKLAVDERFLDRKNFEYRWINDDGARIHAKTVQDDWDFVSDPAKEGKADADGLGSIVSKVVGKNANGQPLHAYLARKPKHYYDEDQAEKRRAIEDGMKSIKSGTPQGDGSQLGSNAYTPEGGISIQDGRR